MSRGSTGTTLSRTRSPTRYGSAWKTIMATSTTAWRTIPAKSTVFCRVLMKSTVRLSQPAIGGASGTAGTFVGSDMPGLLSSAPEDSHAEQGRAAQQKHQCGPQHATGLREEVEITQHRPQKKVQDSKRERAPAVLAQADTHQPQRDADHARVR